MDLVHVIGRKLVRERVRRYGLRSQKGIDFQKSSRLLKENGFAISDRSKNCLFTNNGSETMKHWIVKAMIFKELRKRGRQVGTEVEVSGGIVDVLDLDNMIAYEVENNLTRNKLRSKVSSISGLKDVFFIDILEVPDDIGEAEYYIREKVV
jgi:prophage antirepressor-like protein